MYVIIQFLLLLFLCIAIKILLIIISDRLVRGSPIKVGYCPVIKTHLDTVNVRVIKLSEILSRNNSVISQNPTEILPTQTCVLEMTALRPFAGDTIHDNPRLSRFLIKENRIVVAIGFIRRKL